MNIMPRSSSRSCRCWRGGCAAADPIAAQGNRPQLAAGAFVAAVVVLCVSALGLNATVSFLQLHFKKRALPLAVRSLTDSQQGMPAQLGSWLAVSTDQPVDPEIRQVLGTDQYLFRDYVDIRRWPREQVAALARSASGGM